MTDYDQIISRGPSTDAGALMAPEDVARGIIQGLAGTSAALQLFRTIRMPSASSRFPVLSALPSAYWVGSDTGLKKTTKAQWENVYMQAAEVAVIVPIPDAVVADADYDIFAELRPLIVEAVGLKLDAAIFFGEDVPPEWTSVTGIVPDAIAAGNTVDDSAGLDIVEALSLTMGEVEDDGYDVNGIAAPRRLRALIRGLRDTVGQPVMQSLQDGAPATVLGERIAYISNGAMELDASTLAIVGDFTKGIVGVRQDITFTVHRDGVISDGSGNVVLNLMQQDSSALRVVARFGFVVAKPLSRLNVGNSARYPFATLQTGS